MINMYESCGERTNFTWSFKLGDTDATIEPCIGEYESYTEGILSEKDTSFLLNILIIVYLGQLCALSEVQKILTGND